MDELLNTCGEYYTTFMNLPVEYQVATALGLLLLAGCAKKIWEIAKPARWTTAKVLKGAGNTLIGTSYVIYPESYKNRPITPKAPKKSKIPPFSICSEEDLAATVKYYLADNQRDKLTEKQMKALDKALTVYYNGWNYDALPRVAKAIQQESGRRQNLQRAREKREEARKLQEEILGEEAQEQRPFKKWHEPSHAEPVVDHGSLAGLGDDNHTQYISTTEKELIPLFDLTTEEKFRDVIEEIADTEEKCYLLKTEFLELLDHLAYNVFYRPPGETNMEEVRKELSRRKLKEEVEKEQKKYTEKVGTGSPMKNPDYKIKDYDIKHWTSPDIGTRNPIHCYSGTLNFTDIAPAVSGAYPTTSNKFSV